MKHIAFYLDPVSPYSYLAFEHLPQALTGLTYTVSYRPVLFAALLNHWGQKGPAEIAPKRAWTYRHVSWLARQHGIELQMPAQHPFNPLALLRLLWACARAGDTPSRYACETVLRHVWRGGARADEASRLEALERELAPRARRAQRRGEGDVARRERRCGGARRVRRADDRGRRPPASGASMR